MYVSRRSTQYPYTTPPGTLQVAMVQEWPWYDSIMVLVGSRAQVDALYKRYPRARGRPHVVGLGQKRLRVFPRPDHGYELALLFSDGAITTWL